MTKADAGIFRISMLPCPLNETRQHGAAKMDLDPRFERKRSQICHDLARAQAFCRHLHPQAPPFRLIAISKIVEDVHLSIEPQVVLGAETATQGPIFETAVCAVSKLGYLTATTGARWTSAGFYVVPASMSAHEQLAAIHSLNG